MKYYAGIDLHSTNSYLVVLGDDQSVHYSKRLPNDLTLIDQALQPYGNSLEGVVVESTYNWYWLADGLKERNYKVQLAHTAALDSYQRLKHSDDKTDANWLANLLRLRVLPTGYIYPQDQRGLREVLRKRICLVRQRTRNILSLEGTLARYEGVRINNKQLQKLTRKEFLDFFRNQDVQQAVLHQWELLQSLNKEIEAIEDYLNERVKKQTSFKLLKTVPGVGVILGTTIGLETGCIDRFPSAGHYASYCRCVKSDRISNGKKKGENNRKSGNAYLSWAYVEAANYAIRSYVPIERYYQRKLSKANHTLAIKAVANKLARGSYYVLKAEVSFDMKKAFNF